MTSGEGQRIPVQRAPSPLPGILQGRLYHSLVFRIHLLGSVRLASAEMNAEVPVEIIVLDRLRPVRHSVHGSGVHMPVVFYQNRPALPAPVSVDAFHDRSILFGSRFAVR